jgi:thiol peroxidase
MVQISLKGKPVHTVGHLPAVNTKAPDFKLVDKDLKERSLSEFHGKRKIIITVPSLDTSTCSTMTQHFNLIAKKHPELVVLVVSADLPFAQKRFCEKENVHNSHTLSMMKDKVFGKSYGVLMEDGPLEGILARSVFVLDEKDHVLYCELVKEISQEPDYHKATEIALKHI